MRIKQWCIVTAFLLLGIRLTAQGEKWDSAFRPNNYALKAGQFNAYPHSSTDIVFLGNSITANVEWRELLNNPDIKNRGISGDITFGVLERLDEVINGHPARVFILIGINDISRNIPDAVIVANQRKIVERIQAGSPKTKIYFHTLLPVNNEFTQFRNHYNKDGHIAFVNAGIKALAEEKKITLIDLHPHFLDAAGKLDKKYTVDGLHLTAEGYKIWKALLEEGGYLK